MWLTIIEGEGFVAVELATFIASGFALLGFAIGCVLTEAKFRRVNRIRANRG